MYAFINDTILPLEKANVHLTDLGLLRGYGIFDFFRSVHQKPLFINEHLNRLQNSTKLLELELPYSLPQIEQLIYDLIQKNKEYDSLGIKVVVTGGNSEDGYTPAERANLYILSKPFTYFEAKNGLKLITLNYQREFPEIKTLNYLAPILARNQVKKAQADDVLYFKEGYISETSRSNIFMVKDEKVITPAKNILKGVTRQNVLEVSSKHFETIEKDIKLSDFLDADEVFITGSTKKITYVSQVDTLIFNKGEKGKITQELSNLLEVYLKQRL